MKITADSAVSLLGQLSQMDIRVPPRTEGRTTEHTERYAAAQLLSALATSDSLSYPLALTHRDRPDFALSMNSETLGIEHTEAVPENDAHRSALRERGHGPTVYFASRSSPTERKKTAKQLIAEIDCNSPGSGWAGDSVEREWAAAMLHFAKRKVEVVSSPGFERFPRQWLLIYDNWPAPALDFKDASQRLHTLLLAERVFEPFERVFVMTEVEFCELREDGVNFHPVNNLWKS